MTPNLVLYFYRRYVLEYYINWHLKDPFWTVSSRIEEQRQFIDELCGIAENEAVDLVLVAVIF